VNHRPSLRIEILKRWLTRFAIDHAGGPMPLSSLRMLIGFCLTAAMTGFVELALAGTGGGTAGTTGGGAGGTAGGGTTGGAAGAGDAGGSTWLWILIVVLVVAAAIWFFRRRNRPL
jgi:hypothetical protein